MKTVQYFSDEYLQQCSGATPEQVLEYLESFRRRCDLEGVRYQSQIKVLMKACLQGNENV